MPRKISCTDFIGQLRGILHLVTKGKTTPDLIQAGLILLQEVHKLDAIIAKRDGVKLDVS